MVLPFRLKIGGPALLLSSHIVGLPSEQLLQFPHGAHDDQVDALAWIGLMMTEFATFVEKIEHEPSWRDKLKYLAKTDKRKSAMSS